MREAPTGRERGTVLAESKKGGEQERETGREAQTVACLSRVSCSMRCQSYRLASERLRGATREAPRDRVRGGRTRKRVRGRLRLELQPRELQHELPKL